MNPIGPEEHEASLRSLKTRASRLFYETQDAIRHSVILRIQAASLQHRIYHGEHAATPHQPAQPSYPPAAHKLSPREMMVLQLIVAGKTTREIATELGIAFKTAAAHRNNIMSKLDAPNAAAVVREAFRLGLVRDL